MHTFQFCVHVAITVDCCRARNSNILTSHIRISHTLRIAITTAASLLPTITFPATYSSKMNDTCAICIELGQGSACSRLQHSWISMRLHPFAEPFEQCPATLLWYITLEKRCSRNPGAQSSIERVPLEASTETL